MKTFKISNLYQIHKQKLSFKGIDNRHILNKGNSVFRSLLLYDSEPISITKRPDINELLQNLYRENHTPKDSVNIIRKISMELHLENVYLKKYLHI